MVALEFGGPIDGSSLKGTLAQLLAVQHSQPSADKNRLVAARWDAAVWNGDE